jgi:dipeptidyl aminopeptidase/acylaminoacyl peptidase
MVVSALASVMAVALNASAATAPSPEFSCRSFLENVATSRAGQPVEASDLIELMDIGYPAPISAGVQLALSPDGAKVAFSIQRASLSSGGFCSGIGVVDIRSRRVSILDPHAGLFMKAASYRGPVVPDAAPAFITPRWSPDGSWIAYQRTGSDDASLWRLNAATGAAEPIPGTGGLITDFAWSSDASHLVISRDATYEKDIAAIQAEAVSGHHYDSRFLPFLATHPFPRMGETRAQVIDLSTGLSSKADDADAARLNAQNSRITSFTGSTATIDAEFPDRSGSPKILHIVDGGAPRKCPGDLCRDIKDAWWAKDGQSLVWLRRTGWAKSRQSVHIWNKGAAKPRTLLETDDFLAGCVTSLDRLLCAREGSLHPRHIVEISLTSGKQTTIYDPNAGLAQKPLAPARRLTWSTDRGTEVIGDLVLPASYKPGTRYPLIVTTYQTKGFLRGATGDEYPIQLFASRGFAVLSIERPIDIGSNVAGLRDTQAVEKYGADGWSDRRNVQSAIDRGVDLVASMGIIDEHRVGITGLSDGAVTVGFALLWSERFAAAALSNCCIDPWTMAVAGPATADYFREIGYPSATNDDPIFWAGISPASKAKSWRTPLLMQLADSEFLLAQESLQAFRETAAPVDTYVFPSEGHVKLNPRHRLAIYRRNLAWFEYWLKFTPPSNLEESARWRAMRSGGHSVNSPSSAGDAKPLQ